MNIFEQVLAKLTKAITKRNPTPADFRRGARKHRIVGFLSDKNSKHVGSFRGGITPMKQRFKGVSKTGGK